MGYREVTEFACEGFGDCTKTFSRAEHLARHIRGHTGEKPFKCHCGRAFTRLDNVRQHAATVHADDVALNAETLAALVMVHNDLSVNRTLKPRIVRRREESLEPGADGDEGGSQKAPAKRRKKASPVQHDHDDHNNGDLYHTDIPAYGTASGHYDSAHNPETGSPLLNSLAQAARSYSWTGSGPSSGQQQHTNGSVGSTYHLPPMRPNGPQGAAYPSYAYQAQQQHQGYPSASTSTPYPTHYHPAPPLSLSHPPQPQQHQPLHHYAAPVLPQYPSVLQPAAYDPHNPYPEPEKPNQAHWVPPVPVSAPQPKAMSPPAQDLSSSSSSAAAVGAPQPAQQQQHSRSPVENEGQGWPTTVLDPALQVGGGEDHSQPQQQQIKRGEEWRTDNGDHQQTSSHLAGGGEINTLDGGEGQGQAQEA